MPDRSPPASRPSLALSRATRLVEREDVRRALRSVIAAFGAEVLALEHSFQDEAFDWDDGPKDIHTVFAVALQRAHAAEVGGVEPEFPLVDLGPAGHLWDDFASEVVERTDCFAELYTKSAADEPADELEG